MLIINADDLGRSQIATDRILECYAERRITSTSAMVFMEDSERAAARAKNCGIDLGLHLNFTETLTGPSVPQPVRRSHERTRNFLRASKYALILYNPFLRRDFRDLYGAQVNEFARLYGSAPSRMDGHQHMHLCTNMLYDRMIPTGMKVRRSFSFQPGEKGFLNLRYRKAVDRRLARRHVLSDHFFALSQHLNRACLNRILELAAVVNVELMTHPEVNSEYEFLLSDQFAESIGAVQVGVYRSL